jgi:NitT/TauT family transport system permease protein
VRRFYLAHERAILGAIGVVLFLILWEGFERGWWAALLQPLLGAQAMRFQLKPIFISSPTRIARMAFNMFFVTGAIWKDIGWSSLEFTLGVALSFAIGIPLGLAAGWYRRFNYGLSRFLPR